MRFTPVAFADGPGNRISRLFEDHDGDVWAINEAGQLFRWRSGVVTTYGEAQGLPSQMVASIAEDAAGHLWIGTAGGLCEYTGTACRTLTARGRSAARVDRRGDRRSERRDLGRSAGDSLIAVRERQITTFKIPGGREISALVEDRDGAICWQRRRAVSLQAMDAWTTTRDRPACSISACCRWSPRKTAACGRDAPDAAWRVERRLHPLRRRRWFVGRIQHRSSRRPRGQPAGGHQRRRLERLGARTASGRCSPRTTASPRIRSSP